MPKPATEAGDYETSHRIWWIPQYVRPVRRRLTGSFAKRRFGGMNFWFESQAGEKRPPDSRGIRDMRRVWYDVMVESSGWFKNLAPFSCNPDKAWKKGEGDCALPTCKRKGLQQMLQRFKYYDLYKTYYICFLKARKFTRPSSAGQREIRKNNPAPRFHLLHSTAKWLYRRGVST